jgi:hypothetical protein
LFKVKPQQLEQQINDYRKKSRVIRWLLRVFTRINSKIAVYSYYRQCLSFRELQQRQWLPASQKSDFPVDFTIIQPLLPYLRQDIKQFEQMIDRHLRSLEVTEDEFLLRYQAYARKQEARFFKLLEKQLKGLSDEQQILLRNTLKKEYRGMRKMMKKFTESCLKGVKQVKDQLSPFMPNLMLPLVKSEILYADREFCREFLKDFTAVYENYEKKVTAIYKEMEVQMKEHHAKIKTHHAKIKTIYVEAEARMGADRDEVRARMEKLERLLMTSMAPQQNQAAASDSETAATSYSFFPAP